MIFQREATEKKRKGGRLAHPLIFSFASRRRAGGIRPERSPMLSPAWPRPEHAPASAGGPQGSPNRAQRALHVQYLTARQQGVNDELERHDIFAAFGDACKCQSSTCVKHIRTGSTRPSPAVTGVPPLRENSFFRTGEPARVDSLPHLPGPVKNFRKKTQKNTRDHRHPSPCGPFPRHTAVSPLWQPVGNVHN